MGMSLALIEQPSPDESAILDTFEYTNNPLYVHRDRHLMPKAQRHWSSWNYVAKNTAGCLTYWMNDLQPLDTAQNIFVSLVNDGHGLPDDILYSTNFRHPKFTTKTAAAQRELWNLQGRDRLWFCGAYFGSGFHEDGLQAGLAVAEELGGISRPWSLAQANDRLIIPQNIVSHEAAE